jgi:hypothetical protein
MTIGPISGKVTASTVAASATTLVCSILAPHVFHGQVTPDIQGLIETVITAGITFASGYAARHGIVSVVEKDVAKLAAAPVLKAVEAVALTPAGPASASAPVPPIGG